jgi:hypothetical protein
LAALLYAMNVTSERAAGSGKQEAGSYSAYRLNSSAAFVPPKPNEFDSAYSMAAGRFWFGT